MGFVSQAEVAPGFKMLDYLTDRARGNIISYIDHMKTPLLILHGYRDYRCSFEQAGADVYRHEGEKSGDTGQTGHVPGGESQHNENGKLYNQIRHLS